MRLTLYSDYAMRVLIHLGTEPDRMASIGSIAQGYGISRNHLMKVVHNLGKAGFVESVRGRSGGIRLARPPEQINLGEVLRHTEEGFELIDCTQCVIAPACGLNAVVSEALAAFLAVFDRRSLADILGRKEDLLAIFDRRAAADTHAA